VNVMVKQATTCKQINELRFPWHEAAG
jgi:hypothetical protein